MKSLKFKRLVLVSDTTKSANQFRFQERFNLITGKNNSIGKSSLVKNIFWAIGCEPKFDETWKSLDCKALLEFSVKDKNIKLLRINNSIIFSEDGGEYKKFSKITGDYSRIFSELVDFEARLPNRKDSTILEVPPPAYYFIPFYIDQLRSWTNPWDSFENLGQYTRWKQSIVKYHTGYLLPRHFELEDDICEYESEKKEANEEVKRINTAIEIVEKYVPKSNFAITTEEFEIITNEVKNELSDLAKRQESILNKLSNVQSSKYHLENQLEIAKRAVQEIEKDYQFSVEYIDGDEIECPLCGTTHDNSIVSRAAILSDKQQAEDQVILLQNEIESLNFTIKDLESQLEDIRKRISEINKKYERNIHGQEEYNLPDIVDGFASQSVQKNVKETKTKKQALYKDRNDKQKELKKEQRRLLSKNRKQNLSDFFITLLSEFIFKLNAKGINLNKIKHPTDYNKLFGSGGAAEGTRAVLAYQMAVFRQIYFSENEIPAPLVLDTPNQQEQAGQNYDLIVKLIMEDTPEDSQIILCGMESEHLFKYKRKSNVIYLDDSKILRKSKYEYLGKEISEIQNKC